MKRHSRVSSLDLTMIADRERYGYGYDLSEISAAGSADSAGGARASEVKAGPVDTVKININHCGFYDLQELPGIGPAISRNILAYRDSVGGFTSPEELMKVKGIGPAKYAAVKNRIVIR